MNPSLVGLDGVLELLPPLVAPLLQLIPVVVELSQLCLDLVGGKVALLDQLLRRLGDGVDPALVVLDLGGNQLVLLHQVLGGNSIGLKNGQYDPIFGPRAKMESTVHK